MTGWLNLIRRDTAVRLLLPNLVLLFESGSDRTQNDARLACPQPQASSTSSLRRLCSPPNTRMASTSHCASVAVCHHHPQAHHRCRSQGSPGRQRSPTPSAAQINSKQASSRVPESWLALSVSDSAASLNRARRPINAAVVVPKPSARTNKHSRPGPRALGEPLGVKLGSGTSKKNTLD